MDIVTLALAKNNTGGQGPSSYTLPTASADVLGGVKVGSGLAINDDGTLNATSGSDVFVIRGGFTYDADPSNIVNVTDIDRTPQEVIEAIKANVPIVFNLYTTENPNVTIYLQLVDKSYLMPDHPNGPIIYLTFSGTEQQGERNWEVRYTSEQGDNPQRMCECQWIPTYSMDAANMLKETYENMTTMSNQLESIRCKVVPFYANFVNFGEVREVGPGIAIEIDDIKESISNGWCVLIWFYNINVFLAPSQKLFDDADIDNEDINFMFYANNGVRIYKLWHCISDNKWYGKMEEVSNSEELNNKSYQIVDTKKYTSVDSMLTSLKKQVPQEECCGTALMYANSGDNNECPHRVDWAMGIWGGELVLFGVYSQLFAGLTKPVTAFYI